MGKKGAESSNALAITLDSEGKVDYSAIAKRGHGANRTMHSSFKDLIPLRRRAEGGELSLDRPDEDEVAKQTEKTKLALEKLVAGAVTAQKPKNVQGRKAAEPTYIRYTPAQNQMGDSRPRGDRLLKIVERQQDPMEPPKFKHKKIPRGPPSPPPPVMRSPPRKLTAEDQENWKIPPAISNWKNAKGYTIPLDKRLAASGRGLEDVTINDKFAGLSEALYVADRHAREEVKQRTQMQQRLAEREKEQKEEHLRALAMKAREDRANATRRPQRSDSYSRSRSRSRSGSYSSSRSYSDSDRESAARLRERTRREQKEEHEKKLRQSRMGTQRKMQMMAREQGRDISEKVALGLAKPTASGEGMYDSRPFNQTSGFAAGFNEDQPYDRPLFAAQEAISSIYRPNANNDDEPTGDDMAELERIGKQSRFEVLGKAAKGFKNTSDQEERAGPVQFERDVDGRAPAAPSGGYGMAHEGGAEADPFGIDSMIAEVTKETDSRRKRSGADDDGRGSKRSRVDDKA